VKVYDLDHLVSRERDESFEEFLTFGASGAGLIRYCCFLDRNFVIACKALMIFECNEIDFDRFSEERTKQFPVASNTIE